MARFWLLVLGLRGHLELGETSHQLVDGVLEDIWVVGKLDVELNESGYELVSVDLQLHVDHLRRVLLIRSHNSVRHSVNGFSHGFDQLFGSPLVLLEEWFVKFELRLLVLNHVGFEGCPRSHILQYLPD